MAEDIVQRLGFDAGNAIATINQLKTALDSLNTSLTAVATTVRNFNSSGTVSSKIFDGLNRSVQTLTQTVQKLQTVQASVGQMGGDPAQVQNQLAAINQLTKGWGNFGKSVPASMKQIFAMAKADLASFAAQNKISAAQMTQAFSGAATGSSAAMQELIARVNALKAAHINASNSIVQQNQKMQASFGFLRTLTFVVAIQAFHALVNAITEGVKAAADFERSLWKTVAIEDSLRASIGGVRQELVDLAITYGKDLNDVSEAYYQTLQNQVGDANDAMQVMSAASKLAAANVQSLSDAEELLTATLKGFNLSAREAGRVAGVLFEAIKVGRFEAKDLANIIGRVNSLAGQMGVSVEEVFAAIATMTVQGVRADTAITQLRAVVNQLLKPTKDLKRAMKEEWGVDNAQQAIAKFGGLLPLLKELEKLAGKNSTKMAEFFRNIRALNGAIGLTGSNADLASKNLELLQNATEANVDSAAKLVLEHSKLQRATNLLNVEWTQLSENFSGFAEELVSGLVVIVGGLKKLTAASKSTKDQMLDTLKSNMAQAQKTEKVFTDAAQKTVLENRKKYEVMKQQAVTYISELNKIHQKEVEVVKNSNVALVSITKQTLDSAIEAQRTFVEGLEKATDATNKLKESAQRQADLRTELEDKVFERQLETWGTAQRTYFEQQKARDLLDQGLMAARKARSEEELAAAQKIIERAGKYAESAVNSAKVHGEASSAIRQAKDLELKVTEGLIRLESDRQRVFRDNAAAAAAELPIQKERLRLMEELRDKILEGISKFDKATGEMKSTEQMKEGYKAAQDAFQQFIQHVQANKSKMSLAEALNLVTVAQQFRSLSDTLPDVSAKVIFPTADAEFQRLKQYWESIPIQLKFDFQLKEVVDPFNELAGKVTQSTARLEELESKFVDAQAKTKGLDEAAKGLASAIGEQATKAQESIGVFDAFDLALTDSGHKAAELTQRYTSLIAEFQKLGTLDPSSEAFRAGFERMRQQLIQWNNDVAKTTVDVQRRVANMFPPDVIQATINQMNTIVAGWKRIETELFPIELKIEYENLKNALPELQSQLDTIRTNTEALPAPSTAFQNAMVNSVQPTAATLQSIGQINSALPMMATNAQNATTAFIQMAAAAREAATAAQAAAMAGARGYARGGMQYLAGGGMPIRWTDTIPAMLSPGEYVINAKSARKFFSQLQAINAGQTPIYKETGGAVTNIGDINISVSQGETSRQTARDIAIALRRELRRGTVTLN